VRRSPRQNPSATPCPACGANRNSVTDSRASRGTVRRRRYCDNCNHRWTTYEVSEEVIRSVLKVARTSREIREAAGRLSLLANELDALAVLPDDTADE